MTAATLTVAKRNRSWNLILYSAIGDIASNGIVVLEGYQTGCCKLANLLNARTDWLLNDAAGLAAEKDKQN